MKLTFEEIKEIIPHRYPFLLIDKIEELKEKKSALGIKSVSGNEPYVQGHFPNYAIMPGVLQIEAVAQVGAVALLYGESKNRKVLLGGVKNARFYKPVLPGDQLKIKCEIIKQKGNLGIGKGEIYINNEKVMTCQISFGIVD